MLNSKFNIDSSHIVVVAIVLTAWWLSTIHTSSTSLSSGTKNISGISIIIALVAISTVVVVYINHVASTEFFSRMMWKHNPNTSWDLDKVGKIDGWQKKAKWI